MYTIKWRFNGRRTDVKSFDNREIALDIWDELKKDYPSCVFSLVKKGKRI